MSAARFKIESVAIEAFKAFSLPQEVEFAVKHCFIFGSNALGKSSIVEAIRWALFGGRESDVRSRFREGADCRVEVRLRDERGLWRMERRLRPGLSDSDITIRDPAGQVVTRRQEVLPNLVRLGTSAGAAVFFSAQRGARVRTFSDITRFHDVLYAHLDLGEVAKLRADIRELLEEHVEIVRKTAESVQRAEDAIRQHLKRVDEQLAAVTSAPPWDLDETPTRARSESRIRQFVQDLAAEANVSTPATAEIRMTLEHASNLISQLATRDSESRARSSEKLTGERQSLSTDVSTIDEATNGAATEDARIIELESKIVEACATDTVSDLNARLTELKSKLDRAQQFVVARRAVLPLLDPESRECPICGSPEKMDMLLDRLNSGLGADEGATTSTAAMIDELERRRGLAIELGNRRETARRQGNALRVEAQRLIDAMVTRLACDSESWSTRAKARIAELDSQLDQLRQVGTNAESSAKTHLVKHKALTQEWRYHELREEQQRVRRDLAEGLETARNELWKLEELRVATVTMHAALAAEFDAAIDRALPIVSEQLTDTFRRLTSHPAFDMLAVERSDGVDKLVIRASSSYMPVRPSRPEDVLNNGALTALGLVPHLVFSNLHAAAAELNILIIDDPSQSFDTKHVEFLMAELRRASDHAQLLLATHEEEGFLPIVTKLFAPDSYRVIRVTGFSPERGPNLEL